MNYRVSVLINSSYHITHWEMNLNKKSKRLAYLLRHDREYSFDSHGWREVNDLIANHGFTVEGLCEIVDTNNKKRFEFSADMLYIRARQGHSIPVDVELEECMPPNYLYHGTAESSLKIILREGIKPMNRLYVHLSSTIETAISVGRRHGAPVVLKVDSQKMFADGSKFYLSRNGVWLTDYVAQQYISLDNF